MNESFAPDVSHIKTALSFAACIALGGITVYAAVPGTPGPIQVVHHYEKVPVAMPVPVAIAAAPAPVRSYDLHFVLKAGTDSYIKLATVGGDGEDMPVHGTMRLVETEGTSATAVASVDGKDVPPAYRSWLGKRVVVDGGCTTDITGFAVVARLIGDPGYAGVEGETKWTVDSTVDHGTTILVAKLARCSGTYARDAALPAVIVPVAIHDDSLASEARAALVASPVGAEAEQEWRSSWNRTDSWADVVPFDVRVVRHPITGVTWVAVQAHGDEGCGNPNVNLLGVFEVAADGTLVPVSIRKFELETIQHLVDVDGDGRLEIIGAPWLGVDHTLETADGGMLESLELPFFGCPC